MTGILKLEGERRLATFRGEKIVELTIAGESEAVLNLHSVISRLDLTGADLAEELFAKESPCDMKVLVISVVTATQVHVIRGIGKKFSTPHSTDRHPSAVEPD